MTENLQEKIAQGQEMSETRVRVILKPEKLVFNFLLTVGTVGQVCSGEQLQIINRPFTIYIYS